MKAILQAVTVFAAALTIAGCQTPGTVISENVSPQCPSCQTVTKTGPIKGTTMSKMHCPSCKTTYIDEPVSELGDKIAVHSCSACGINVKDCDQCSKAEN